MIKVNPNERFDINQVVHIAELQRQILAKKPKIDPFLIMDDIMEKLRLLEYEKHFCQKYRYQTISRLYFAHNEVGKDPNDKLKYFYELSYWLMGLSKVSKDF